MTELDPTNPNRNEPSSTEVTLSEADAAAVDALMEAGWEVERTPAEHEARARAALALLSILERYPIEDDKLHATNGSLVERTLAAIRQSDRYSFARALEGRQRSRPAAFSWQEFAGAAAAFLVLSSMSSVMLSNSRSLAQQQTCRSHMQSAGFGFASYANDFGGAMPINEEYLDTVDWRATRANQANLFELARKGYATLWCLSCPNNQWFKYDDAILANDNWPDDTQVSFSYQNMFGENRPTWAAPTRMAVLADRNPLIDRQILDLNEPVTAESNSFSHFGAGQNVLFNDGSCEFKNSPNVDGDNIWTANGQSELDRLTGSERPAAAYDAMLVH
ncbi:MAG: hypothetical protein ACF8PN_10815 [Phycisphaerales bacterium]